MFSTAIDEFSGLTVDQVIKQSVDIHPEWDWMRHRDYFSDDTSINGYALGLDANGKRHYADNVDEQCKFPGGCEHERMPGLNLCIEHYVNITRLLG